jgi:hypothetical protein
VEVWAYGLLPNHAHLIAVPWSSAAPYVAGDDDGLIPVGPLLALVGKWTDCLDTGAPEEEVTELHRHERSGRPLAREPFVVALEGRLGRTLQRGEPGPKRGRATQLSMVSPEFRIRIGLIAETDLESAPRHPAVRPVLPRSGSR